MLFNNVIVTEDHHHAAEEVARWIAGFPPEIVINAAQSAEEVLVAPYLLVGSVEQIVEDLQERRERFGVS